MHGRAGAEGADQPISLKKIRYEPFKGRLLFHTTYSEYFKQNVHVFDAFDFLAELTQDAWPRSNPKDCDHVGQDGGFVAGIRHRPD